jgi:hypothetical protein
LSLHLFFTSMSQVMTFKASRIVESFWHLSHLCSFSSVCIRKCCFKFELSVHPLPQYEQQKSFLPVSVSVSLNLHAVHTCHMSCYMWFRSCMWKPMFFQFTASNKSFPTKLTEMWFLSSVYHVVNPEIAGITEAYAAHSTCIPPIIAITDKWAWLVGHSTRHCAHMKSVDTGSALFPLTEESQTKCSQLQAEECSSSCNKGKNSTILP